MVFFNYSHADKSAALPFKVAGIVLAAGLSRRLGRPKQLLLKNGRILLAHVLDGLLRTDLSPIILVLGHLAQEIQAALSSPRGLANDQLSRLTIIENPDYASGQASSIKAGINSLPFDVDAAIFLMGDQPGLNPGILDKLKQRASQPDRPLVVEPRYGREPGAPILWRNPLFPELLTISGDQGGRALLPALASCLIAQVDFPAEDRPLDLDTLEDYQAWLAALE